MNAKALGPALFAAGLLLAVPLAAQRNKDSRVVVSATATPEFEKLAAEREYFTYHLAEGKYFGGVSRDPSLRKTPFEEVAATVAEALSERRFYPARDVEGGDLLIVVSWGSTTIDQDVSDLLAVDDFGGINDLDIGPEPPQGENAPTFSAADAGAVNSLDFIGSSYHRNLNARILGYHKGIGEIDSLEARNERRRLRDDLEEERYFIVLNAIDLPRLRATGETRELWSTRYSVRNRGTNFKEAVVLLNKAASGAFGVNLDTLHAAYVDAQATTEAGELEIIGIEPIVPRDGEGEDDGDK